jgi:hypothetical protein
MRGRRVDIERLAQETFSLKIIAFHELSGAGKPMPSLTRPAKPCLLTPT